MGVILEGRGDEGTGAGEIFEGNMEIEREVKDMQGSRKIDYLQLRTQQAIKAEHDGRLEFASMYTCERVNGRSDVVNITGEITQILGVYIILSEN